MLYQKNVKNLWESNPLIPFDGAGMSNKFQTALN